MRMVLQVETGGAIRHATELGMDRLERLTEESQGHGGPTFQLLGDSSFLAAGPPDQLSQVFSLAGKSLGSAFTRRSTDQGLVFEMTPERIEEVRAKALDQTVQTIRSRLDQFGVDDPVAEAAPGGRISVRLPAVEDPERIGRLIRRTALLEFRLVGFPAGGGGVGSREAILQHYGGQLPPNLEVLEGSAPRPDGGTWFFGVQRRRVVTGGDFLNATAGRGQFGEPVIEFRLRPEATQAFGDATGQNVGSGLAIVLDGRVVSAPKINSRITDRGEIEGKFSEQEVQDLVALLRSGALPAPVTVVEEHTVSPSPAALRRRKTALIAPLTVLLVLVVLGFYAQRRRLLRPPTATTSR
jgi:preprotein translocase subunit SecD